MALSVGDRDVLFAGGKGGVGKTTVASALALRLAGAGERVLLVSTDPAHSLGDLFGREIGDSPVRLAGAEELGGEELGGELRGLEVDPEARTDRYLAEVKRTMRAFVRPAMYDEIDRQMELTRRSPGAREAAVLDRITEVLVEGTTRHDRLVFDTAPTGHTLRLLSLPEVMAAWMDGLLASRDRSETFGEILRDTGWEGGDELSYIDRPEREGGDERADRIREVLERRRRKFLRARRLLTDPDRCGFLLVLNPDELSIRESERVRATLEELEMPVLGTVVNKVLPADGGGSFLDRRREHEARHLERIERLFGDVPRVRIPLLATDVRGIEELREIADRLGPERGG